MRRAPITLDRFILEEQQSSPGSTGELSLLLVRLGIAAKRIAAALAGAGFSQSLGSAGSSNVQGEEQKKLDVVANDILLETFDYGGLVTLAASEEMEEPVVFRGNLAEGRYAVLFDPMDGSSNIDVNGTLGTIFSIRRRRDGTVADLLRAGHEQVAAGYFLFGPAVLLVYTCGDGVHLFTLDSSIGEFLLTRRGVRMPERGRGYAVNEGRAHTWAPAVQAFVEHLKIAGQGIGAPVCHPLLGVARRGCAPVSAGGRHLPVSGRRRGHGRGQAARALRVPSARPGRRAGRGQGLDRNRAGPRRRALVAARAHGARHREPGRGRPLRRVRREGMTRALLAAGLFLALGAAPRPAATPAPKPAVREDEERAERPVRFVAPASEMKKLSVLLGAWEFTEAWREPVRYKRGEYEGVPGEGGSGTLTVRPGPGGFSLVLDYDARNPMGRVTALAVLAWDPARRVYELDEIHSAFPAVLHLTGRFEKGDLVFRGRSGRTGEEGAVRLVWKGLGQDAWTATLSGAGEGGRMERVWSMELSRKPGAP